MNFADVREAEDWLCKNLVHYYEASFDQSREYSKSQICIKQPAGIANDEKKTAQDKIVEVEEQLQIENKKLEVISSILENNLKNYKY